MAGDLNRVVMIGRLTQDVTMRQTKGGTSVASFSIASNRKVKRNEEWVDQVSFFNCTAWGKIGESIDRFFNKGNKIAIEGRLEQQRWKDQQGQNRSKIEVVVESFFFCESKDSSENKQGYSQPEEEDSYIPPTSGYEPADNPFSDDDIPF